MQLTPITPELCTYTSPGFRGKFNVVVVHLPQHQLDLFFRHEPPRNPKMKVLLLATPISLQCPCWPSGHIVSPVWWMFRLLIRSFPFYQAIYSKFSVVTKVHVWRTRFLLRHTAYQHFMKYKRTSVTGKLWQGSLTLRLSYFPDSKIMPKFPYNDIWKTFHTHRCLLLCGAKAEFNAYFWYSKFIF